MKKMLTMFLLIITCQALTAKSNVLILHSYHKDYRWTDEIHMGLMSVLQKQSNMDIYTEYLDTKRFYEYDYLDHLVEFYKFKVDNIKPDIIILSDNNALNFVVQNREDIFNGIPVVFLGVNGFSNELIKHDTLMTGIEENISVVDNLELYRKLFPDKKGFVFIGDTTFTTYKQNKLYVMNKLKNKNFNYKFLENIPFESVTDTINSNNGRDYVFSFISAVKSNSGVVIRLDMEMDMIDLKNDAVLMPFWDFNIGEFGFGGKLISGFRHGQKVAEIALDLIGKKLSFKDSPVIVDYENNYYFSYPMIQKYNINVSNLPENNVIVNTPESFFQKYKRNLIQLLVIFSVLVLILAIISYFYFKTKKSRNNYKNLFDYSGSPITVSDSEGIILEINQAAIEFFKIKNIDDDINIKNYYVNPDEREIIIDIVNKEGFIKNYPLQIKTSDNEIREVIVFIKKRNNSKKTTYQGVFIDISETKQLVDKINKLAYLIEQSIIGFCIVNEKGEIDYYNNAFGHLLELKDISHIDEIFNKFDEESLYFDILKRIDNHQFIQLKYKKGYIDMNFSKFMSSSSNYYSIIIKDVSSEVEMQDQLAQSQKLESLGRITGGVAHDFNNILMAIINYCEILRIKLNVNNPNIKYVNSIIAASFRARDLINQLLTFSKKNENTAEPSNLNEIINSIKNMLKVLIGESIVFTVDLDKNIGNVNVSSTQLEQIIINLVTNAKEAFLMDEENSSMKNKYIKIFTTTRIVDKKDSRFFLNPGKYVVLTIEDNGPGIDNDNMEKIFEPYYTTKESVGGTGLGLATTYGIIKKAKGDISVYSEPDKGAAFRIYLPVIESEIINKNIEIENVDFSKYNHKEMNILFVEDDKQIRESLIENLKNFKINLIVAENGLKALNVLEDNSSFDLIITDIIMPVMDGVSFAKEARSKFPDIPIIFSSGYAERHMNSLKEFSNAEFIQKPYTISELLKLIYK